MFYYNKDVFLRYIIRNATGVPWESLIIDYNINKGTVYVLYNSELRWNVGYYIDIIDKGFRHLLAEQGMLNIGSILL